jgi:uncharacterized protein (DUF433 family)
MCILSTKKDILEILHFNKPYTKKEILETLDDELRVAEETDKLLLLCYPNCTQEQAMHALARVSRENGLTHRIRILVDMLKKVKE